MYIQDLTLSINTDFDKDKLLDEFQYLLSCFRKSGQSQSDNETFYIVENLLKCNIATLEVDSLYAKNNTEWVTRQLNKLEDLCCSQLQVKTLGKTSENHNSVCQCDTHNFLVLFTHIFNDAGPIDCGTCLKPIPLYRFKQLDQVVRQDILRWEENYISCDRLQIHSRVGEKWATKQMTNHSSQLSKEGKEICNKIKTITGIPTFYYLFNFRRLKTDKDKQRPCPSCNGQWLLENRIGTLFDFKCNKCELISSVTSNGY